MPLLFLFFFVYLTCVYAGEKYEPESFHHMEPSSFLNTSPSKLDTAQLFHSFNIYFATELIRLVTSIIPMQAGSTFWKIMFQLNSSVQANLLDFIKALVTTSGNGKDELVAFLQKAGINLTHDSMHTINGLLQLLPTFKTAPTAFIDSSFLSKSCQETSKFATIYIYGLLHAFSWRPIMRCAAYIFFKVSIDYVEFVLLLNHLLLDYPYTPARFHEEPYKASQNLDLLKESSVFQKLL